MRVLFVPVILVIVALVGCGVTRVPIQVTRPAEASADGVAPAGHGTDCPEVHAHKKVLAV